MRKLIFFTILSVVAGPLSWLAGVPSTPARADNAARTDGAARAGIAWETDFERALRQARAKGKPVLVNFWAPWCPPCRVLDREVFTRRAVIDEARHWVCIKVDVSRREDLYARYKLTGTPTLMLLNAGGQVMKRRKGLLTAQELVRWLRRARS